MAQEKAAEPPGVTQAVGGAVAATAGQAAGAAVAGPIGAALGGAIAGVLGNRALAKKAPKPCPPLATAQAAEPEGGASTTPVEPESGQTPPAQGEPPADPAPAQQPAPTEPLVGPNG